MPIKRSKDADYSLASNKNLSHEIGSLGWRPKADDGIQNAKTYLHNDIIEKPQNFQNILKIETRRLSGSLKDLNSSLSLAAGE